MGKTIQVRFDMSTLMDHITEIINASKSNVARKYGVAVDTCLDIMCNRLQTICNRAIQINDPVILSELLDMGCIKEDNEQEYDEVHERAQAILEKEKNNGN